MAKRLNERGYVYIITNPIHTAHAKSLGYPDKVKIGYSGNLPYIRAAELYNSSCIDTPFDVFAFAELDNAFNVEQDLHLMLSNTRTNDKREFFYISPEDALKHLRILAKYNNGTVYYGSDYEHSTTETVDKKGTIKETAVIPEDTSSNDTEFWFQGMNLEKNYDADYLILRGTDFITAVVNAKQKPGDYIIGYCLGHITCVARIDEVVSEEELLRRYPNVTPDSWGCSVRTSRYLIITWLHFCNTNFTNVPELSNFKGSQIRCKLSLHPEWKTALMNLLPSSVVEEITK